MNTRRLAQHAGRAGLYAAALAVMAFAIFPVYWILATALKPNSEVFSREPALVPREITGTHFDRVITGTLIPETSFWSFLTNSLLVTVGSVVAAALMALLAALAVARFRFRLRTSFILLLLIIQMVPIEALIITLFVNFHVAGQATGLPLVGSLLGVVVVYTTVALPITILMMRSFVAAVPPELEESAALDGASRQTIFWRILMPLVAPGLVAASIFAFITAWNEFLVAYTFLQNSSGSYTLPVSLRFYFGRVSTDWGAIMAASTLLTIPVMVFFLFVQKRLVAGLTLGAVKG